MFVSSFGVPRLVHLFLAINVGEITWMRMIVAQLTNLHMSLPAIPPANLDMYSALLLAATLWVQKQKQSVQFPSSFGGSDPSLRRQATRATKDYANSCYSTLEQINAGNLANLTVAWTFDTSVARGQ